MGQAKDLFMELREQFIQDCENVEDGNVAILDTVLKMREERAFYEEMTANIKAFETEHFRDIEEEARGYDNNYKGATFEFRDGRKMFSYKNIPEWNEAKSAIQSIEKKYKSAWGNVQNGLLPVDENGEELELPEVSYGGKSLVVRKSKLK